MHTSVKEGVLFQLAGPGKCGITSWVHAFEPDFWGKQRRSTGVRKPTAMLSDCTRLTFVLMRFQMAFQPSGRRKRLFTPRHRAFEARLFVCRNRRMLRRSCTSKFHYSQLPATWAQTGVTLTSVRLHVSNKMVISGVRLITVRERAAEFSLRR